MSQHPDKTSDSKKAWRWRKRLSIATLESLQLFHDEEEAVPALEFLECAPWRLLTNETLPLSEIDELISVYRHDSDDLPYRFPQDSPITDIWCWEKPCKRDDSASLAMRGDIYGFFAILALVREAEARSDFEAHIFHFRNLCQSLPLLGRFGWQRPDFGLLCDAVRNLRDRVGNTASRVGVYWFRIEDLFRDPSSAPNLLFDPLDPNTLMPAGLPNMTYLASATDIGEPPIWPASDNKAEGETSFRTSLDLPYHEASELCADKTLLIAFANMAGLWELPGQVCAACLDIKPADLPGILGEDPRLLTDRRKTRIAITLALLSRLGEHARSMNDCGYILRRPLLELQGESVLSMLSNGQLIDVAKALDVQELKAAQDNEFCFVAVNNIRATF